MIVFNLDALVAIAICAVLVGPLYFFDFMQGGLERALIGTAGLVIGGIVELAGLKPRLFFLPVWLIGLGVLVYQAFDAWGWWGLAVMGGVLVTALVLLGIYGWQDEKKQWRGAPDALQAAKAALLEDREREMWQALERAFFLPAALRTSARVCLHDREVLAFIREHLDDRLDGKTRHLVAALDEHLAELLDRPEPELDDQLAKPVRDFLRARAEDTG
ncbi:MAG: hypothetical protein JXR96_07425 [Deltaproteobacteria bacterium]|nr:hypothetical protein [Deltaproteobacteria bacterium]